METLPRKERKENSLFDNNKRMILEGYLLGKTGFPKIMLDTTPARKLKHYIVDEKYSPYATLAELNSWTSRESTEAVSTESKGRNSISPIRTLPVNEERTRTTIGFSDAFFLKAATSQKSRMRKFPRRSTGLTIIQDGFTAEKLPP